GAKTFITGGVHADRVIVCARTAAPREDRRAAGPGPDGARPVTPYPRHPPPYACRRHNSRNARDSCTAPAPTPAAPSPRAATRRSPSKEPRDE
ncbi:hypothetical protein AB0B51_16550, partial [Streptomyces griseus]